MAATEATVSTVATASFSTATEADIGLRSGQQSILVIMMHTHYE